MMNKQAAFEAGLVLGEHLRNMRIQAGCTQEQAAEALHLDRHTISDHECGRGRITMDLLQCYFELYSGTAPVSVPTEDREGSLSKTFRLEGGTPQIRGQVLTLLRGELAELDRQYGTNSVLEVPEKEGDDIHENETEE